MYGSVRVSKKAVCDVLSKYFSTTVVNGILDEICMQDDMDAASMVGMTVSEWMDRFDDCANIVWAADTGAGFGKKGDTVYGDLGDCVICGAVLDRHNGSSVYTLYVWCEGLSTDDKGVNSVMRRYLERTNKEEVRG